MNLPIFKKQLARKLCKSKIGNFYVKVKKAGDTSPALQCLYGRNECL